MSKEKACFAPMNISSNEGKTTTMKSCDLHQGIYLIMFNLVHNWYINVAIEQDGTTEFHCHLKNELLNAYLENDESDFLIEDCRIGITTEKRRCL